MYTGTVWLDDYQEFSLWQTNYSYNARDDLVKVVDALGNTTVITYDGFGLKTGMKDPDMGVWTYGYDPAGNLITQTDAKGQTVWFGYDGLNRLTQKRLNGAGGPVLAQYGYDSTADNMNGIGRRTSISNTHGQTRWAYDWRGRVAQEYITITGRAMAYGVGYQYDAADRLTRMTYPNGEAVTTTYDAGGQPYSLLGWSAYVVSATYNALGQPYRTRFGNGLEARYTYFTPQELPWAGLANYGRLRRICVLPQGSGVNCENDATPPAEALLNIALNYDAAGNVTIWRDAGKQERQRFEYDSLNRLIAARPLPVGGWTPALAAYTETYAYNAIGNFVSKGGVTQWYSDTAHAHAVTHLNGERRAWYDQNGNMTQRVEISAGQRITYTQEWDVENKLVAVTNTVSGQVTRFYRDADGNLVKKSDGAGTVMIVNGIFEHIPATNQSTSYYMLGSPRLRGDDGVAMRVAGAVYWLHGDHLGSASLTTNASGQKVAELRYLPFGETRWAWGTTPTDRRYTGQRELAGGLYDYNARMYAPGLGRFVSADTIVPGPGNPQSFNRYAYALNNPLRYNDPTGHSVDDPQPGCPSCRTTPASVMRKYNYWTYKKASPTKAAWKQDKMVKTPWAQVAPEDRHYLQAEGITEGAYNDWVFGEKNETTEMGLFFGSLAAGAGKFFQLLVRAAVGAMTRACADGDCANEVQAIESSAERLLKFSPRNLQHTFGRHATQMGFSGNWSRSNAQAFQQFLYDHVHAPATQAINGTYRGTIQVVHYFNPYTQNVVITDRQGNMVAALRLSHQQISNLYRTGNIQ